MLHFVITALSLIVSLSLSSSVLYEMSYQQTEKQAQVWLSEACDPVSMSWFMPI